MFKMVFIHEFISFTVLVMDLVKHGILFICSDVGMVVVHFKQPFIIIEIIIEMGKRQ